MPTKELFARCSDCSFNYETTIVADQLTWKGVAAKTKIDPESPLINKLLTHHKEKGGVGHGNFILFTSQQEALQSPEQSGKLLDIPTFPASIGFVVVTRACNPVGAIIEDQ